MYQLPATSVLPTHERSGDRLRQPPTNDSHTTDAPRACVHQRDLSETVTVKTVYSSSSTNRSNIERYGL